MGKFCSKIYITKEITFMGERVGDSDTFHILFFGRMTCINIWNSQKKKMTEGGNIVDWDTAEWRAVEELIEK
jgi:hypothetical protein